MGLDQGIRKMSPEIAAKLLAWQENPVEDEYGPLTDQEYERIEQLWVGRKENHIHRAVEEITGQKVKNCDYLFLNKRDIELLVAKLNGVSAVPSRAAELLPTQEGFFFGGTQYDEWYYKDIEQELSDFEDILEGWDESASYAYWAWW